MVNVLTTAEYNELKAKFKAPKIELKKISFNERMSEETNAFVADLYINGKKVGYAKNDGRGGCTVMHGYSREDYQVIMDADAYCKTLPKVKSGNSEYEQDLESVVDQLLEDYLTAKERKKMEKYMLTGILFGIPNSGSYSRVDYKHSLSALAKVNHLALQARVNQIKERYCTKGEVILNTNLTELGISI